MVLFDVRVLTPGSGNKGASTIPPLPADEFVPQITVFSNI